MQKALIVQQLERNFMSALVSKVIMELLQVEALAAIMEVAMAEQEMDEMAVAVAEPHILPLQQECSLL